MKVVWCEFVAETAPAGSVQAETAARGFMETGGSGGDAHRPLPDYRRTWPRRDGRGLSCQDPAIGRSVAIKTIRIRDINDTAAARKTARALFREARSAGVLSHPNIVTIYDMDEADGLA